MHDNIKLGDLVSQQHPSTFKSLKVGIVIDAQINHDDGYLVRILF